MLNTSYVYYIMWIHGIRYKIWDFLPIKAKKSLENEPMEGGNLNLL